MAAKGQFKSHCIKGHIRSIGTVDPKSGSCKLCRKEFTKKWQEDNRDIYLRTKREKAKEYRKRHGSSKFQFQKIRLTYNLSEEDFIKLKESQDNKCAVCKLEFTNTPQVDHNHSCCSGNKSCGKCVRGLLCIPCNIALGCLRDSIDNCLSAADYLRRT